MSQGEEEGQNFFSFSFPCPCHFHFHFDKCSLKKKKKKKKPPDSLWGLTGLHSFPSSKRKKLIGKNSTELTFSKVQFSATEQALSELFFLWHESQRSCCCWLMNPHRLTFQSKKFNSIFLLFHSCLSI